MKFWCVVILMFCVAARGTWAWSTVEPGKVIWEFQEDWLNSEPPKGFQPVVAAEKERIFQAPIPPLPETPLWLEVRMDGWNLQQGDTESLAIGFTNGDASPPTPMAGFQLYQPETDLAGLLGVAEGRSAANTVLVTLPNPIAEPVKFALYLNRDANLFALFYKTAAAWRYVGAGRLPAEAAVDAVFLKALGAGAENALGGLRRVVLGTDSPGPELPGKCISKDAEDAPPFFTAAAWAIMDADSGEVLASQNADRPAKTASVTKSMATYVIAEMARENPAILEEMVEFTDAVTRIRGSKLGLEAGEKIKVKDALYGFMVRSGNDAGNALAAHFNDRMDPPQGPQPSVVPTARRNFIAEMNRTAKRLGMDSTAYRSAFGDGGPDHAFITTANDLLKLAAAAMENPLFRDIANTAAHTAPITKPDGSTYEKTWTQENPLRQLGPEDGFKAPFSGIKGGFTTRARFNFLGSYADGANRYFTVVIGCPTREISRIESRTLVRLALDDQLEKLEVDQ